MTEQELFLDPVRWDDTITTDSGVTITIEGLFELFRQRLEHPSRPRQKAWKLPPDVDKEAWEMWASHRLASGLSMRTNTAKTVNAKVLQGRPREEQLAIVQQSIHRGWRGLFPLKSDKAEVERVIEEQFEGAL